jgi:3-hydroxyacyl-[acyl-carrier-protein] dehydratase
MQDEKKVMDIAEIKKIIPHRFPFLLVDKILEVKLEPVIRAVGIKNVTYNEPFFQGHFPDYPIMPGVLVIESLAQTACIAGMMVDENKDKIPLFTGIEDMKIRRQVLPGDTLILEAEFIIFRRGVGKVKVRASVQGQTAVEGIIKFAMMDSNGKGKP